MYEVKKIADEYETQEEDRHRTTEHSSVLFLLKSYLGAGVAQVISGGWCCSSYIWGLVLLKSYLGAGVAQSISGGWGCSNHM